MAANSFYAKYQYGMMYTNHPDGYTRAAHLGVFDYGVLTFDVAYYHLFKPDTVAQSQWLLNVR